MMHLQNFHQFFFNCVNFNLLYFQNHIGHPPRLKNSGERELLKLLRTLATLHGGLDKAVKPIFYYYTIIILIQYTSY